MILAAPVISGGGGLRLNISQAISALPDNPFKYTDLGVFISNAIGLAIIGAAVFALFYLLWGAFDWITSGGDKGAIEGARNKIMASILGLTLAAAVWAIFGIVQVFLGINIAQISVGGGGGGGNSGGYLRCPGPNCDRCPGWPGGWNPVPKNDPAWKTSAQCP
ncbi:hypothetical protein HY345_00665 [Candidatus Microgenomates bacterium]|nr:hypothetical protein [Candidatus Microgenomates bacterium]